ncbi:hypothetical protein ACFQ0B_22120 [Nonomuraea thailandensis]
MTYPDICQMAGSAIAAIPQSGSRNHCHCGSPIQSKSRFSPTARSCVPEFISHRHTMPVATNEMAIGNR